MILVAGGTGFVGRALVNQLLEQGEPVRLLVKPSKQTPVLPRGIPVEITVSSLLDERSLRSAFRNVDVFYHLVSDERRGGRADFAGVDVAGTESLIKIARQAGVSQLVFLSHLGTEQGSAFAMLQAKAIAENLIARSRIPYTILRSSIIFGPGDHFTTSLARLLKISPGIVLIPGQGATMLQPIWIDDLIACLIWTRQQENALNQTYSIGGGEYLTFRNILETVMQATGRRRYLVSLSPVYIRAITLVLQQFIPRYPISIHWLDYLADDRTCSLDTLPRTFGILPSRFSHHLDYLKGH